MPASSAAGGAIATGAAATSTSITTTILTGITSTTAIGAIVPVSYLQADKVIVGSIDLSIAATRLMAIGEQPISLVVITDNRVELETVRAAEMQRTAPAVTIDRAPSPRIVLAPSRQIGPVAAAIDRARSRRLARVAAAAIEQVPGRQVALVHRVAARTVLATKESARVPVLAPGAAALTAEVAAASPAPVAPGEAIAWVVVDSAVAAAVAVAAEEEAAEGADKQLKRRKNL